jgi:hypothetical protein
MTCAGYCAEHHSTSMLTCTSYALLKTPEPFVKHVSSGAVQTSVARYDSIKNNTQVLSIQAVLLCSTKASTSNISTKVRRYPKA